MGTNYYVKTKKCKCCGHKPEDIHIGKSSAGWTFSFKAQPKLNINSWTKWKEYLKGKQIVDEYNRTLSLREFEDIVISKQKENHNHTTFCKNHHKDDTDTFYDEEGHSFSNQEFC